VSGSGKMKLYLGLTENSPPHQPRIFVAIDGKLVDVNLAYAAYLAQAHGEKVTAYELAAFYFPESITGFLQCEEAALKAVENVLTFARTTDAEDIHGPAGEKVIYDFGEIRIVPPLQNPEKTIVIGFSDQARIEAMPKAEIPTGFYKLPSTFIASGEPIIWPNFSDAIDCDACLALVIGKPARRIQPDRAWDHIAGVTLLLDITARDINKREGLTRNNLLGKNFPSSTSLGPALLLKTTRQELDALEVELAVDGIPKQRFSVQECVFSIEQIISHWSILGLKAGDILAIGASMAVQGNRLRDPVPLTLGATIRCFSPPLGELSHAVVPSGGCRR
jgi:2-keto-4-pentenoate hydratase/2-oxohepta-3-ene-1,7-dioic acid hydratase in catechol pathway